MIDKNLNTNVIFVPYIFKEHTKESLNDYNLKIKEYKILHECCPKCKSTKYQCTLAGFIMKDDYKDLNTCICSKCNDKHTVHDRIPGNKLREKRLNFILND